MTSFYDLFGYLVENFRPATLLQGSTTHSCSHRHTPSLENEDNSFLLVDLFHWLRRLVEFCVDIARSFASLLVEYIQHSSCTSDFRVNSHNSLTCLLRRAIVMIGLKLRPVAQPFFDDYMRDQLRLWLNLLAQNEYLAPMLLVLRGGSFL